MNVRKKSDSGKLNKIITIIIIDFLKKSATIGT